MNVLLIASIVIIIIIVIIYLYLQHNTNTPNTPPTNGIITPTNQNYTDPLQAAIQTNIINLLSDPVFSTLYSALQQWINAVNVCYTGYNDVINKLSPLGSIAQRLVLLSGTPNCTTTGSSGSTCTSINIDQNATDIYNVLYPNFKNFLPQIAQLNNVAADINTFITSKGDNCSNFNISGSQIMGCNTFLQVLTHLIILGNMNLPANAISDAQYVNVFSGSNNDTHTASGFVSQIMNVINAYNTNIDPLLNNFYNKYPNYGNTFNTNNPWGSIFYVPTYNTGNQMYPNIAIYKSQLTTALQNLAYKFDSIACSSNPSLQTYLSNTMTPAKCSLIASTLI